MNRCIDKIRDVIVNSIIYAPLRAVKIPRKLYSVLVNELIINSSR